MTEDVLTGDERAVLQFLAARRGGFAEIYEIVRATGITRDAINRAGVGLLAKGMVESWPDASSTIH